MAKKTRFTGFDKTLSPYFKTVPNEKVPWRLQSVDGKYFGDVSWEAYKAVEEFNLDSYKPKNKKEEKVLNAFRSYRSIPVYDEAKRNIGSISYDASMAFKNGKLDEYKPKDESEKNVLERLRKESILPFEIEVNGEKKYFGDISYNAMKEIQNDKFNLSTWSKSDLSTLRNYWNAPVQPLKAEVDGKEKIFGYVSRETLNKLQENTLDVSSLDSDEKKAVEEFLSYLKKEREPKNVPQGILHGLGYAGEKIVAGAAGGIENLFYGSAALLGNGVTKIARGFDKVLPGDGSAFGNMLENTTKSILEKETLGEALSEDAESRFRVPDWYRQYIGTTAEGFGNLLPAMATEYFTAGASPMGDMALAKMFAQSTAKKSLVNTIKTSLTTIKPSDIVFSGSAMGSAAKTAYKQTGDVGKSLNYGVLNGLGEFATERLFGGFGGTGIGAGGKTVTSGNRILKILDGADDLIDVTKIKGVSKLASTKYGKKVLDIAFEGVEEMIMADLDPWMQRATINPDAKSATWKERGESFLQGILLSGFSNAATYSYGKVRNIPNIKELNVESEKINATLPNNVNKLQPLKLTASGKKIIDRAKDIQRIKGINDVNRVSDAINAMMKYDKDKLELLTYDATIDEVEKRQEQIGVFATGYADLMVEELVKNNPEKFADIAKVSIGDKFVDTKTGYKVTVINRDAEKTTVEINTGKNIITKAFSNNQADRFATSEQMIEIDDTTVAENTTVDEPISAGTQTVAIGDEFVDTKTGNAVKVIDRDANKTTVSVVMSDGVKVKPMTNTEFDNVLARGQLERITPVESAESVSDTSDVSATSETPIENINLKRVGKYYEVYGEEAKLLAAELDLETTKVVVNGVETDMLRLPADLTEKLASTIGDEFNLVLSDKPISTEDKNATVTDETTSTDEVTPSAEENATEGEISNVVNAIEETLTPKAKADLQNGEIKGNYVRIAETLVEVYNASGTIEAFAEFFTDGGKKVEAVIKGETVETQTETLKNESESDTIESKSETTPVESEDNGNERFERTVEERTVHNDENVERTDGERTGRSSERVSGKTGNAQKTETERTTRKKVATVTFDEVKGDYYTPEMKSLEKGTYDKYGVVVKYFYGECIDDSGSKGDAFYYKGVLYIQADAETSLESRIDHEITHHFGKSNAMTKFRNAVKAKMPKAEYDSWYSEIKEAYGDVLVRYLSKELKNSNYTLTDAELQQLMDEYIEEEMLANLNGEQVPFATEYRAEVEAFRKEIGNHNTENTKSKATSESKTRNIPAEYTESIDAGGNNVTESKYDLSDEGGEHDEKRNNSRGISGISKKSGNKRGRDTGDKQEIFDSADERKVSSNRRGKFGENETIGSREGRLVHSVESSVQQNDNRNEKNTNGRTTRKNTQTRLETNNRRFRDALDNNDDSTAREMLDSQAEMNEFVPLALFHGTRAEDVFTVFDEGSPIWVTKDYDYASKYAYGNAVTDFQKSSQLHTNSGSNIYPLYGKLGKVLELGDIEQDLKSYDDIKSFSDRIGFSVEEITSCIDAKESFNRVFIFEITNTPEFAELARKKGYDSLHALEKDGTVETYGILYPENVKSSKLKTYDDKGKLIPLSERFDNTTNDIRYDIADNGNLETQKKIESIAKEINSHDELVEVAKKNTQEFVDKIKENKSLQKRLKNAKRQMLLSPKPIINIPKVGKVTNDILKEMDSTLKATDLKDEIISIYTEYFDNIKKASGVESKTQEANDNMMKRFANLAINIAESAETYAESEEYLSLKSYLKDVRIKVPESAKSDVHYAEFRKSHMGTFNLTNDGLEMDVVYQELCEMFPGMFDENITHPADQLLAIADKYESLKPYAYNPHLEYMQDAVDHIVYRFASEVDGIAASPKTKAQKIAEKGAYDKEMALEKERVSFERKLDKHKKNSENIINKLQKKIGESEYVRYWEKRLSKEEKAQAVNKVREKQKVAVLKTQIRNIVANMKKKLDKTEKNGGYPKELVKAVADVCSVIDFHTDKTNKDGTPTKSSLKLDALKMQYDALKNNENYDFASEYDEGLSSEIQKLYNKVKDKRVIDLNATELSELKDILSEISQRLSNATKQIGIENAKENAAIGSEIIESLNSRSDVIKSGQNQMLREIKLAGQQGKSIVLNPHRINKMIAGYDMNSAWWELYDGINRGSRKASKFVMDATKPFDELTDGGGNEIAFYDFRTKNIKTGIKYLDGSEVEIPKSIICELVMMWDRKQGRTHLETGGAKIPDMTLYNKGKTTVAITDAGKRTAPITQVDIDRLKTKLDSYDKAWIEKAHYLFNNVSKNAINEVSMELIGRELAKEENYIRMYVDQDFIRREIDGKKEDATLESHGSLKETVPNAKQPVVLRGLHENVYDNIDFSSKYYGLAIPIRNFNKVYNIVISEGDGRNSVKELIGQKFGSAIRSNVVEQLIRDLQAPRPRNIEPFGKIRGKWLGATFWGNIRSALKQTTSYWTASSILSESSLAKGVVEYKRHTKQTKAEIGKHSGTLYKRSQGLSTTELGDRANRKLLAGASNKVTKLINEHAPVLRKIPEWIRPGNWLQSMDCAVASALWEACKIEVSKTMDVSDDGYIKAVTDMYERVIEETQSNYDVAHRPEALKNTNAVMRTITMFQTDNLQQSGILFDAYNDYKTKSKLYEKDKSSANEKAKDEAKKGLSKAIRSRVYSSLWLVFVTQLGDMLLRKFKPYIDDEEKEITSSSIAKQSMLMLCDDMLGVLVPVGGQFATKVTDTFSEGYDFVTVPTFDVVEDFIKATSKIWDAFAEEDGDVLKAFVDAVPAISSFTGIPAKNISDLYKSIKGYAGDIKSGEFAHDLEDYTSGNKSFYSYGDLASYIASGDKEKETKWKDYYSANGKDFAKGSLTKEIKPAYVQMYVDSPEKAYNIKKKLILDYDYTEADIDGWLMDEYLKHIVPGKKFADKTVSNPEYAAEIKGVLSDENKWNTTSVFKATKSYYKKVYKDGDEKETKALREALLDDGVVTKANLDVWENQADNEIKNQEKKLDAEKEKFKE